MGPLRRRVAQHDGALLIAEHLRVSCMQSTCLLSRSCRIRMPCRIRMVLTHAGLLSRSCRIRMVLTHACHIHVSIRQHMPAYVSICRIRQGLRIPPAYHIAQYLLHTYHILYTYIFFLLHISHSECCAALSFLLTCMRLRAMPKPQTVKPKP